jgi:putative Holliday junction resolvase
MPIYLGLDYGEKHIGVAVATTILAEPLEVINTNSAIERISLWLTKYHITDIVLGISENETAEKTKVFAKLLEDTFHLPLHFQDETLSSQDTRRKLAQSGLKRSIREAKIDHYVAATILQDYLDSNP